METPGIRLELYAIWPLSESLPEWSQRDVNRNGHPDVRLGINVRFSNCVRSDSTPGPRRDAELSAFNPRTNVLSRWPPCPVIDSRVRGEELELDAARPVFHPVVLQRRLSRQTEPIASLLMG